MCNAVSDRLRVKVIVFWVRAPCNLADVCLRYDISMIALTMEAARTSKTSADREFYVIRMMHIIRVTVVIPLCNKNKAEFDPDLNLRRDVLKRKWATSWLGSSLFITSVF